MPVVDLNTYFVELSIYDATVQYKMCIGHVATEPVGIRSLLFIRHYHSQHIDQQVNREKERECDRPFQ